MAFNIFATATSDIPLANLDANFTMIGSSAVASTLYPTATTSITYGTTGTEHIFSAGKITGPHNGTVGATTPSTGAFTTLSASSSLTMSISGAGSQGGSVANTNTAAGAWASWGISNGTRSLKLATLSTGWSGTFLTGGPTTEQSVIYTDGNIPIVFGINSSMVGQFTSTGLNSAAIGATTPSTGAFTTLSSTGDATLCKTNGNITAGYATSGGTLKLDIYDSSLTSTTIGSNRVARIGSNVNGGDCTLQFTDSVTYNLYISAKANHLYIQPATAGTYVADFSSTGLAVTGTLSATAQILSNGSGGNISGISTYTNTLALAGSSTSATTSAGIQFGDNFNASCRQWGIYNGRNSSGQSVGTLNFVVSSGVNADALANTIMTLNSTGLDVTGTLSATGDLSFPTVGSKVNFTTTGSATVNYVGGSADGYSLEMVMQRGASQPLKYKQDYAVGHVWNVAGSDKMTLDSTGNLLVGVATANANGGVLQLKSGITFPATAVAATDANTLDDYEKGTWTPNQGSGVTVVGAFSSVASYTKIGRLVYVTGYLTGATSIACTGGGGILTTNLPFTAGVLTIGIAMNGSQSANSTMFLTGTTLSLVTSIAATSNIYFAITYSV